MIWQGLASVGLVLALVLGLSGWGLFPLDRPVEAILWVALVIGLVALTILERPPSRSDRA